MSHQTISFIKSGVRILGYGLIGYIAFVPIYNIGIMLIVTSAVLVASEVIGIVEEIGHE